MKSFRALLLIATFAFLGSMSSDAQAGFYFGNAQYIKFLQDVPLKSPNGEPLFLGHMYRTTYFIAGLYVTDEGYVLGLKRDSNRFLRMNDAAQVGQWQNEGLLPKQFPPYRLSVYDYLIGYSFWITLAVILGWRPVTRLLGGRTTAAHWKPPSDSVPTRLPGAAP